MVEIMLIAMLFVSLLVGNEFQQSTTIAFKAVSMRIFLVWCDGCWFLGFRWCSIFALGKHVAHSHAAFYLSGMASVVGVLCLRMFIIYAGQTFGVWSEYGFGPRCNMKSLAMVSFFPINLSALHVVFTGVLVRVLRRLSKVFTALKALK